MDIGMLWTDDDLGGTLDEKIRRGAQRYRQERGHMPTICWVNPGLLPSGEAQWVDQIHVRPGTTVLQGQFWFGRSSDLPQQSPPPTPKPRR